MEQLARNLYERPGEISMQNMGLRIRMAAEGILENEALRSIWQGKLLQ